MRETFSRDRSAETMAAEPAKSAPPHGAKLTDM
jgi:exopolysaccharide production repressor protein